MSAVWKKVSGVWMQQTTWSKVWKKTSGVWNILCQRAIAIYYRGTAYVNTWDLRVDNTGGCTFYNVSYQMQMNVLNQQNTLPFGIFSLSTKVDVTAFSRVKIVFQSNKLDTFWFYTGAGISYAHENAFSAIYISNNMYSDQIAYLDISGVTGLVHLLFQIYAQQTSSGGYHQVLVREVTLE
ncbi:hypothetical protein [Clostridium sp. CF012]|uniref:hypothetical protein n=1 Tax=Clostridium sp. CF012 TaxID=2843319 RepID=UPI001C0B3DBD|nr:hypothetical protein [Clostridium sp. CF012]MBU3146850.1 hypothetical protein [Clostridium sp. CF012]